MSHQHTAEHDEPLAEISRLRAELAAMRQRVAQLEGGQAPLMQQSEADLARARRAQFDADIEFISDFDIVQARGVNISSGGICFEICGALSFDMKFDIDGEERIRGANLVWMKSCPDNGYQLGFEFVSPRVDVGF
jgi:hypothetical protein